VATQDSTSERETEAYIPSLTSRRRRRTRAEMERIRDGLYDIVEARHPITNRGVFYQAVKVGLVDKTEQEYKGTVSRLLVDMRREGELPYGWITDGTRWQRKPATHSSLDNFLHSAGEHYRRQLWNNQDAYVEIWLEKDALSGVLYPVTSAWDVPLMVTRGYPSITFLYDAAETMALQDKPAYLYYFGDHDPSGVDIPRKVEKDLRDFLAEYATETVLTFERVAVLPSQIEDWSLPTRPTKQTDTRARHFQGESVEVDAIEPEQLRDLAGESITQHIDQEALEVLRNTERREREILQQLAEAVGEERR
jgi:hypothetical protein